MGQGVDIYSGARTFPFGLLLRYKVESMYENWSVSGNLNVLEGRFLTLDWKLITRSLRRPTTGHLSSSSCKPLALFLTCILLRTVIKTGEDVF